MRLWSAGLLSPLTQDAPPRGMPQVAGMLVQPAQPDDRLSLQMGLVRTWHMVV